MSLTHDEETLSFDAYSSAGPHNPYATLSYTRVYRQRGTYAHLEELIYTAHRNAPPSWDDDESWYGTGAQEEYEVAASMPLCPKCFRAREGSSWWDWRLGAGHGVEMR